MKISVFAKVLAGYLFMILALSGVNLIVFSDWSRDLYRETVAQNLSNEASFLKSDIGRLMANQKSADIDRFMKEHGRQTKVRITVVDAKGVVFGDSEASPRQMENHRGRPEIAEALEGRTGKSTRFSSTTNKEAMYLAIPLTDGGKVTGALRLSMFMNDVTLPSNVTRRIVGISIVLTFLALVGAFLLSRSVLRPIKDLVAASKKLATGDFSARVFLKRNDEFKVLGDTFNTMGREIQTAFDELGKQKTQLTSIIDSLQEGLVVIDKEGMIVYSNESLKAIVGRPAVMEGSVFWEVLGDFSLMGLVDKARSGRFSPLEEVAIGGKAFLCTSAQIDRSGEIVMVLHDVTAMKEIERIKRDLVTNVSHELRTPLTSIKGFAETLSEEVGEEQKRYVEVIMRNTDRLTSIVRDLLTLSQLEERGIELELEPVDLTKLAENTMLIFDQHVREKGLTLTLEADPDVPTVAADPFKMEQVLTNLIDNAIKYTDKGTIAIALKKETRGVVLEIKDTGIGIPKESLPLVFERFYVVDKSRSRKTGGTGLGLSIVKHIVLLHGGEITVNSESGRGSIFTVRLPYGGIGKTND
jgi:two-component system, OmpR family, phosphate regulon sensor histidine kinase PhoR